MSVKILFLLAFATVVFGLDELKESSGVVSKETAKTIVSSSGKLPDAINDETNLSGDFEEIYDEIDSVPLRFKRRTCKCIRFRAKSGKIVTACKCN